ncbi:UNVERIFIED_CONTAM: LOB domain-containing protein 2 [Sesamum calycinum]|uniref:LOB domain-containing protein 2 n=1 Tax=Sesamum calycinum TaxID=2727403 RepID=A0AAW2MCX1_9LAMI
MRVMQTPTKEVHREVHISPLLPGGENPRVPSRAQGVWRQQRHKDHRKPQGRRPEKAVDSLVWEALCRQKDPVLGPYGEYRRLCEELRLYKSQYQQFHQVQAQGSLVYKAAAQELMGWNNNKVMSINDEGISNNNNTTNNFHSNGNNGVDFCPYGYSSHHIQDTEKLRAERANGSALILPQQHLANSFSQQYFLTSGVAKTLAMPKP